MIADIVTVLPPLLGAGIAAFVVLGALDAHHHHTTTAAVQAAPTTPGDTR